MILACRVPALSERMTGATVECLWAEPGAALEPGSRLLDLSVELAALPGECPPISFYRLVLRERAYLRALDVAPGAFGASGERIALFTTEPHEDCAGPAVREARTTLAGIMHHERMWTGNLR